MGVRQGAATYEFISDNVGVEAMLMRMDTALQPTAIAGFLGATVDPFLRGRAKDRFNSEGDDVSGNWPALSSSTQDIRASMGYGPAHPINVRTGLLEEYIVTSPHDINIGIGIASLGLPGTPATGALLSKLKVAQAGTTRGPARPVLGMNENDLLYVLTALSGFFAIASIP